MACVGGPHAQPEAGWSDGNDAGDVPQMKRGPALLTLMFIGLTLAPAIVTSPRLASDLGGRTSAHAQSVLGSARDSRASAKVAPMRHVGLPGLPARGPDLLRGTIEQSTNWAGYDAIGASSAFASVTASWVQPAIRPSSAETYASFWVGLDGDGTDSSTVEQTGTLAYSQNGTVRYEAWYEMYPAAMQAVPLTISPGDSLTATVTSRGGGTFALALTDSTTGQSADETESNSSATCSSAEVIAEAPSGSSGVFPLANFGTVSFAACSFNQLPIGAFAWYQIDMASSSGAMEAATSALGADGASFSVSALPTLSSFTPTSGAVGSSVTLTGSGFGDATAVSFNGSAAAFTVDSDTKITVSVPAGATSGTITVATAGGMATSATRFTVLVTPHLVLEPTGLRNGVLNHGKGVAVNVTLAPLSLAGSTVTLTAQRRHKGTWSKAAGTTRKISTRGVCTWTYKPVEKGSYRVRATLAATPEHTAAKTAWRVFRVR